MSISAILPAFNEEENLPKTVQSLRGIQEISEIIVVDDGSVDSTAEIGRVWADRVIRLPENCGKGEALRRGCLAADGDILLFLDSDLGKSSILARYLLLPVLKGNADMAIAIFQPPMQKAGFGLVKGLARQGIRRLTGYQAMSPLSGQRAITRQAISAIRHWDARFGIEVGMTIDLVRAGYQVMEIPIPFTHRETGRDLSGFIHRGKQLVDVGRMLGKKWLLH